MGDILSVQPQLERNPTRSSQHELVKQRKSVDAKPFEGTEIGLIPRLLEPYWEPFLKLITIVDLIWDVRSLLSFIFYFFH